MFVAMYCLTLYATNHPWESVPFFIFIDIDSRKALWEFSRNEIAGIVLYGGLGKFLKMNCNLIYKKHGILRFQTMVFCFATANKFKAREKITKRPPWNTQFTGNIQHEFNCRQLNNCGTEFSNIIRFTRAFPQNISQIKFQIYEKVDFIVKFPKLCCLIMFVISFRFLPCVQMDII